MKYFLIFCLCLGALPLKGEEDIQRLIQGNQRFTKGDSVRKELAAAQFPFCAVLACSDSRVAPELIFDQGLGDLFVVRLAGNVASPAALDSLDFASNVLKVRLIVVLGHENCGAVNAVMQHTGDTELGAIATLIAPAVKGKTDLKKAVADNVKAQMQIVLADPGVQVRLKEGSLKVVGAVYHFDTGIVEFLNE